MRVRVRVRVRGRARVRVKVRARERITVTVRVRIVRRARRAGWRPRASPCAPRNGRAAPEIHRVAAWDT